MDNGQYIIHLPNILLFEVSVDRTLRWKMLSCVYLYLVANVILLSQDLYLEVLVTTGRNIQGAVL